MSKKSRIYILQAGDSLNGVHFVTPPGGPPPACRTDKSHCRTRTIRPLTGASRADRAPSRRAYARGAVGRPMGDSDATRDMFSPLAARVRPTASLASTRSPSSRLSLRVCVARERRGLDP